MDRANDYGSYGGRWPAIVIEYDPETRLCMIEIPGVTDRAEAEIEYPIGDKSRGRHTTEIEILDGDAVWVSFIEGDPRHPIITGYRNARRGNATNWRRWHQTNVEILGDDKIKLKAARIDLN